jgi:hypothetical protein
MIFCRAARLSPLGGLLVGATFSAMAYAGLVFLRRALPSEDSRLSLLVFGAVIGLMLGRVGLILAGFVPAKVIDDHSRFRVLRLYRRLNQTSSLDFLAELRRRFPFPIRKVQRDNGSEFSLAFSLAVQEASVIDTSDRDVLNRTGRSSGVIESITRNSGAIACLTTSRRPPRPSGTGNTHTISSASLLRWAVEPRPRNSLRHFRTCRLSSKRHRVAKPWHGASANRWRAPR